MKLTFEAATEFMRRFLVAELEFEIARLIVRDADLYRDLHFEFGVPFFRGPVPNGARWLRTDEDFEEGESRVGSLRARRILRWQIYGEKSAEPKFGAVVGPMREGLSGTAHQLLVVGTTEHGLRIVGVFNDRTMTPAPLLPVDGTKLKLAKPSRVTPDLPKSFTVELNADTTPGYDDEPCTLSMCFENNNWKIAAPHDSHGPHIIHPQRPEVEAWLNANTKPWMLPMAPSIWFAKNKNVLLDFLNWLGSKAYQTVDPPHGDEAREQARQAVERVREAIRG